MVVSGGYDYGDLVVDPTAGFVSWPDQAAAAIPPPLFAALRQYLAGPAGEGEPEVDEEFMMYEFKVRRCARARSHDWTGCPYAHPGEAARRRDPRRVTYSGEPCPDFRRRPGGTCPRGNACKFAHGTFELWLHPSRYRTRPCRAGAACGRRVCFFAHSQDELRGEAAAGKVLSPKSTLVPLWESPPVSPAQGRRWLDATDEADVGMEMEDLVLAMRELSIGKAKPAAPEMPVLPPVTEEDGPDLGWVSELVM